MSRILDEIKLDIDFIRSHTLQPRWYKVLKIFILLGFLLVYDLLFGGKKMIIFLAVFFFLSAIVHLIYRMKTRKYTQSWLDFKVVNEDGKAKPVGIGIVYYSAVIINVLLAVVISQLIV
jgi:hypothetical protein